MKGIILAAGKGTRLRPLTNHISKILLPVYDKPMIYYGIEKLRRAGIDDIAIVISPEHEEQFRKQLADEQVTFIIQKEAKGTGHALKMTEDFADGQDIAVLYGDNLFEQDFDLTGFQQGCRLYVRHVEDPRRFGVIVPEGDRVVGLEEKPDTPPSDLAIVGFYVYDNTFYDRLRNNMKLSERGEYEVYDAVFSYMDQRVCEYRTIDGFWSDAGTHDTLLAAGNWAQKWRQS
ncbi:MAG: sugar nucleotidyltransferase [Nanoarchaeota archaeon]